jgi:hypothetical protein
MILSTFRRTPSISRNFARVSESGSLRTDRDRVQCSHFRKGRKIGLDSEGTRRASFPSRAELSHCPSSFKSNALPAFLPSAQLGCDHRGMTTRLLVKDHRQERQGAGPSCLSTFPNRLQSYKSRKSIKERSLWLSKLLPLHSSCEKVPLVRSRPESM